MFMPAIYRLQSIKIDVYSREYLPPHFHALYAEYEMLIEIQTLENYGGYFPVRQHKQVLNWAKDERVVQFLLENFYRLNPTLRK